MAAFPYIPSNFPRPAFTKSEGVAHHIPLSNGADPKEYGPNRCVFSAPLRNTYTPETQKLVQDLMKESRLTFSQQSSFFNILRKGEALPVRPSDIYRQELCRHRHAERARASGLPVMPPMFHGNANAGYPVGKRRSYEQIKKSGDLDVPSLQPRQARKYIWVDKEKEKERFAHKMATGKELPVQDKALKVKGLRSRSSLSQEDEGKDEQTQIKEMQEARFIELIHEIQDRLEFLDQMRTLNKNANTSYISPISAEVQNMLTQMRQLSPERTEQVVKGLELEKFFGRLGTNRERRKTQVEDILCQEK